MSDNPPPTNQPQPEPGQPQPAASPQPPAVQPQPIPTAIPPQLLAQLLIGGLRPGLGVGGPIAVPVPGIVPIAQTQQTVQLWQGQYPPPDAVEHYERVLPGSFDRMIAMAERLQAAQIEESKRVNHYAHLDSRRGHWLGFSATGLAMLAALVALAFSYPWVAA